MFYWFVVNFTPCTQYHSSPSLLYPFNFPPKRKYKHTYPKTKTPNKTCFLQWVTAAVWGLWLLLPHQYWILMGTPLRYPGALDLRDWLLHSFQMFKDAGWSKLTQSLDLGVGINWVGQPTALLNPHHQGTLSSPPWQCWSRQGVGPALLPLGWLILSFHHQGQLLCLPRWGAGPALLSALVCIFEIHFWILDNLYYHLDFTRSIVHHHFSLFVVLGNETQGRPRLR